MNVPSVETHPTLRQLTRSVLTIPFAKGAVRRAARFAIQKLPVSRKNKKRVYNLLAAETVPARPVSCTVRMPGGRQLSLELDLTDGLSRSWYYFGYDDYERSTIALWAQLVDRARTVFDVGANIGLYTLLAAARLQGRGAVHAFEPNNEVFAWLTRNTERNRLDNAHLSQIALSNLDGQASFFIPKNRAWTNGSLIEGFIDRADPVASRPCALIRIVENMGLET